MKLQNFTVIKIRIFKMKQILSHLPGFDKINFNM